jgi:hypothetical protein
VLWRIFAHSWKRRPGGDAGIEYRHPLLDWRLIELRSPPQELYFAKASAEPVARRWRLTAVGARARRQGRLSVGRHRRALAAKMAINGGARWVDPEY